MFCDRLWSPRCSQTDGNGVLSIKICLKLWHAEVQLWKWLDYYSWGSHCNGTLNNCMENNSWLLLMLNLNNTNFILKKKKPIVITGIISPLDVDFFPVPVSHAMWGIHFTPARALQVKYCKKQETTALGATGPGTNLHLLAALAVKDENKNEAYGRGGQCQFDNWSVQNFPTWSTTLKSV